jgi:3-methyladenine DNA glycosylase AlkD
MSIRVIQEELCQRGDPQAASFLQGFFKTGPGEYGAGDRFRGIRVPVIRKLATKYQQVTPQQSERLLRSPFHEDRLLALLIIINLYRKGDEQRKAQIYELYLKHTKFINNWDLVDVSAGYIVGAFLTDKSKEPLYILARSSSLWERRIAMMATFHFIRLGEYQETLTLAGLLLGDKEDLIHKAVGWMLREVGKRDLRSEVDFLRAHYKRMPRTMLRYAIEKFPPGERQKYLRGEI